MPNHSEFQQNQCCGFVSVCLHVHTGSHAALQTGMKMVFTMTLLFKASFSDGSSKAFDQAKLCGSMESMHRILSSCRKIAS